MVCFNIPNENPPLCTKFHYTKEIATQPKDPFQRAVKLLMNKLTPFLLLLSIAFLYGCSADTSIEVEPLAPATQPSNEESPSEALAGKGKIGYSAMSLKNPFFVVISQSLTAAAKSEGYEVITMDADSDVKRQANQIEDFISQGVAAIVLNPTDRLAIGPAIKQANEAGIPIFTCDLQCVADGIEIAGHIGTDNFQGGELAGEAMIETLGDEGGEILVLDFNQANSCVLRVQGFKKVIASHNEGRESGQITIISEINGGGDRDIGYRATVDSLQAHPNLRGIFAINDPSALGAWSAIDEAEKAELISIVGFDGALAGKQAIAQGKIYADPIQFPKKMGQVIMEKFTAFQSGEEYEQVELIPTSLYRQADAKSDPDLQLEQ